MEIPIYRLACHAWDLPVCKSLWHVGRMTFEVVNITQVLLLTGFYHSLWSCVPNCFPSPLKSFVFVNPSLIGCQHLLNPWHFFNFLQLASTRRRLWMSVGGRSKPTMHKDCSKSSRQEWHDTVLTPGVICWSYIEYSVHRTLVYRKKFRPLESASVMHVCHKLYMPVQWCVSVWVLVNCHGWMDASTR